MQTEHRLNRNLVAAGLILSTVGLALMISLERIDLALLGLGLFCFGAIMVCRIEDIR